SVMTGLAFASRVAAAAGLAGVEPKKDDRKLFFLGSIGATGMVPAVRIGPPFSRTFPEEEARAVALAWVLGASGAPLAAASVASAVLSSALAAWAAADFFSPGFSAGRAACLSRSESCFPEATGSAASPGDNSPAGALASVCASSMDGSVVDEQA